MSIRIITDSASDLPREIIAEYSITVVPLLIYLGEQEYLDSETIDPREILQGMREGKVYKTAQVPAGKFREAFSEYARQGDSCIYIAFSSGLSGTCQTGVMVRNELIEEYPDFDLDIIDTQCASLGFGLVVLKAAQMAREGKSKTEIVKAVEFFSEHMEHIFTVDDLEYLYRGGRVSRTAAFIGGLLNIKPILDVEDGKLIPCEKIRGRKKVFQRMVDIMNERGTNLANQTIGISHGDDLEAANMLQSMIQETFGSTKFVIHTLGGAVGAHAGPGTLALFFLNEEFPG